MLDRNGCPIQNEALYSLIAQYIEDNYEGYSYREAYHFVDELKKLPPISEPQHEVFPSIAPSASEDYDIDADPFDDIFKIFDKRDTQEKPATTTDKQIDRIQDLLEERGHAETFTEHMLRIISEKELVESEVYHSVFMDRKLFNKIRNNTDYQPSKRTALQIAIALKLTVPEAQELLAKAGYTLTHCSKTDLIVECCLLQGVYDIFEINEMLDAFGMPPLMNCK